MWNLSQLQYTQLNILQYITAAIYSPILIGYALSVGNWDFFFQGRGVCSARKTFCFYFSEVCVWKSESLLGLLSPWLITFVQRGKNANWRATSEFWLREWAGQNHSLEAELGWIHNVTPWKGTGLGSEARLQVLPQVSQSQRTTATTMELIADLHPMCL